ncbi:hypothetical protein LCGC14_1497710 [marine sediment metagenome]|uniref:Uncharacterized protein n=1 Tax=marine sediment metagenome TaxID=412755 RepID=A0A0F9J503_9ZZZZ
MSEEYNRYEEECEHNRPFFECEICGNVRKKKTDIDEIQKAIAGVSDIIKMAQLQKRLLLEMLEKPKSGTIQTSIQQEVLTAIDNYIANKNIAYRREDNQSVIILKIINADTNSSAEVRIIDLDWI